MSSPRPSGPTLRYVIPRLKPTVIGNVPYLLIDDYIAAAIASKTRDYRDKQYLNATINAALASEKAVINSLNSPALMRGFNFYGDALAAYVKEMILRAFKTRYPDLSLPMTVGLSLGTRYYRVGVGPAGLGLDIFTSPQFSSPSHCAAIW